MSHLERELGFFFFFLFLKPGLVSGKFGGAGDMQSGFCCLVARSFYEMITPQQCYATANRNQGPKLLINCDKEIYRYIYLSDLPFNYYYYFYSFIYFKNLLGNKNQLINAI